MPIPPDPKVPANDPPKDDEDQLDDALGDTFPASDPPAVTRAPKEKRDAVTPPSHSQDREAPAVKRPA